MSRTPLADGVLFERVSAPDAIDGSLGLLPADLRQKLAGEFNEFGRAARMDGSSQCVYHMHNEGEEMVIVSWGPMSTLLEAAILLSSVKLLVEPLDEETAVQLYRRASFHLVRLVVEPMRHPTPNRETFNPESVLRALQALPSHLVLAGSLLIVKAKAYAVAVIAMTRSAGQ
jgi:hypothetical protein